MRRITPKLVLAILAALTVTVFAQENTSGKHFLAISHEVADYDSWKAGFDAHVAAREASGLKDVFVKKDISNSNSITVFFEVTDLEKAKAFLANPDLKAAMKKSGVTSPPQIAFYKPASEFDAINSTPLVTMLSHPVKDFSAWKAVYDSAEELRKNAGITDDYVFTSLADENVVTVISIASSEEKFKEFISNPELKETMAAAGVTSKPEVRIMH